jgi:hypothetical protein
MQVLNHGVFVLDVLFDLVNVLWVLAKVLLFQIVDLLLGPLGGGENVLDGVGDYEVFITF